MYEHSCLKYFFFWICVCIRAQASAHVQMCGLMCACVETGVGCWVSSSVALSCSFETGSLIEQEVCHFGEDGRLMRVRDPPVLPSKTGIIDPCIVSANFF